MNGEPCTDLESYFTEITYCAPGVALLIQILPCPTDVCVPLAVFVQPLLNIVTWLPCCIAKKAKPEQDLVCTISTQKLAEGAVMVVK